MNKLTIIPTFQIYLRIRIQNFKGENDCFLNRWQSEAGPLNATTIKGVWNLL